ncbi:protein FAM186A [Trachypithecus francoisi]|uniref:protein FAM186A n=1 Tax=Trachypithecus francoisi TaxID=54180 RepID=UPI00141B8AF5|nr:protein FAM186A [Trachypithecus francoisi]
MFFKMKNEIDDDLESEKYIKDSTIMRREPQNVLSPLVLPNLEIPFSVKDIISRIERAQLHRAREDIDMQLSEIMNNVHRIMTRYTLVFNSSSERNVSLTEQKKKQRTNFLEKMATYAKTVEIREKTLANILVWLEEWNAVLSEMTLMDVDEHHHWIAQMEMLPDMLKAIEKNVKILSRFSTSFLDEKKKQKKKILSRGTLWKSWKERVIKRPSTAHALRPDQMISDQFATNTKVSEIQGMLQELIGTTMFSTLENNAIKYISSTIVNLSKALSMLNDELKGVNFQSSTVCVHETSEAEKELSLKVIQDLSNENEMLQQKLHDAEEKCEQLIRSKIVTEQVYAILSTSSTLKVLPGPSPQSSRAIIKVGDTEDNMDNILDKELENIVDEVQRKETKDSGIKWESSISYTAQAERTPDLTELQQQPVASEDISEDSTKDNVSLKEGDVYQEDETDEYQSWKRKHTKGTHVSETSGPNLSDNKGGQKVSEAKPSQYYELQALKKKRKEMKSFPEDKSKSPTEAKRKHLFLTETKSQGGKSGTSMMLEQFRKVKRESPFDKRPTAAEFKVEPTTESLDKEREGEISSLVEPLNMIQFDDTAEPQKIKIKGKKHHISSGTTTSKEETTEEKEVLTKQVKSHQPVKSLSRVAKETSESARVLESPDGKSEQSNLEEFQKAIMAFLKQKIDNTGKPFDKKTVPKEEALLKRAEAEKLGIVKAKMEEYFQKVAETVTKILRKYKEIKKEERVGEKPIKQKKVVAFMPGLHFQKSPISAKSESSTFLSHESTDPVINNLMQTILAEIESERDIPTVSAVQKDHREMEKQRWEQYLQEGQEQMSGMSLKQQFLEERNLLKEHYEKISENWEEKKAQLQMKEGKQEQQKQKQWQKEEMWKKEQKQTTPKQAEREERQKQSGQEEEELPKSGLQRLEEGTQQMKAQGLFLEKENGQMRQTEKEVKHLGPNMRREKGKEKQKPERGLEGLERQTRTKDQMQTKETQPKELETLVTQTPVTLSPRWKSVLKDVQWLYEGKEFHGNLKTLENLPDEKEPISITPPHSPQPSSPGTLPISGQPLTKCIHLTPQQAQEVGIPLTPQQGQALEIPLTPQQAQAPGIPLTTQQAQELGIPLTPQGAQELGITVTPQQAQELGIPLTPQQAQANGITLTPLQAQALGIPLTPQQAQELGIPLTPQQAQALGIPLTPQQAKELGIPLTPQQAQALGIPLTPQQAQELGIPLTPQQAQALGISLTPQQAQELGIPFTPQQAQELGIPLTPQQAQALGIPLTPQQAQAQGIPLTPQQAQALGIPLTPQQAQELGIPLTPQQAQSQGIPLIPQQAQALGIPLIPQQAQAQGIPLTPQQAQALGIPFTPQQAQELGIPLTPQQAQALGIPLTPQQAQELGIPLTPQQAQALGSPLTPQQAQAPGIPLTPQQAQELGIPLTPQQAQAQGIPLTPQQAQELGILLTPQQAQAQGIPLTLQQAQALGIPLTPQQAQELGIPLTPQQAQELGIPLTPQQAQSQGITLTPHQAQALGIPLTPQQAQAQGILLTPQQAQELGILLTPQQAQELGIPLTPQQAQELGIPLTPQQAQAQGIPLTPQQAQELGILLTPQQAQAQGITLTLQQAQALGIPLTPQQAQALGIPLTPQQVQAQGIPLTPQQAQALGIPITPVNAWVSAVTLTPEQTQVLESPINLEQAQEQLSKLGVPLTLDKAHTLGSPLTLKEVQWSHKPFQKPKASLPTGQSIISRLSPSLRLSLASSVPTAEKSSILQISTVPLNQGPFAPGKPLEMGILSEPGKLGAPQTLHSSGQILVYGGQSTSAPFPAPQAPPTPGQLRISGAPPTPGQPFELEAFSSRELFVTRASLTPPPPQMSNAPLAPRQRLIAGVPPTSGQIPSLWAPLSPGQHLVPEASAIPGDLLESGPLTFSEQLQEFQPPATAEQSPCLQAPSTSGQHLAPWTLPGRASSLWIPPTSRHPPTLWPPPTPGKPQKGWSPSVAKQRLAIISSLTSKSALIHPRAPAFKVAQVPFTTKKFQMPEASDTSEETQILFRTFQSHLTKYRTPVSQTPYTGEGALPTLMKPTSLSSLTTLLKTSQISPLEWYQKSRFPPIDKPWILSSVSGTKKPKIMAPPSSPQELEEKRYFVDVEAQKKNLILLNQAIKTCGLPSQLHTTARTLIIETLHTDTVQLGYLFRKYIAYRLIQYARNNIVKRLKAIQNTGKGYEARNLHVMLSRLDDYGKKVMQVWTEKQKSLGQKRNQCLKKMIHVFNQLKKIYELNLSQPIPLIIEEKQIPASTTFVQKPFLKLLVEEDRTSDIFKKFRQPEDQTEAIWNVDLSTSSYPIAEKTSMHSLWAQLGGYPDIPRLLQLEVQSTFRKSLASLQSQVKKIPK